MTNSTEMPRYRCHKEVWALKIKDVMTPRCIDGRPVLTFADPGYGPIEVEPGWVGKHNPQPGGYYVVYPDGYASYSPAKAFEEGYTRIGPK